MTLEELERLRAAIPDDDALPASTTRGELAALRTRRRDLDRRLLAARNAKATLAQLPEPDTTWLDHLTAWRKRLCDEVLAMPPRALTGHELGLRQNLTLSIRVVDFGLGVIEGTGYGLTTLRLGQLMREEGYEVVGADPLRNYGGELPWFGSMKEVEKHIKDMTKRRADAQAALDEALLDDDERAKRDAEADIRRDALNALPTRKVRGDGSYYDVYPDGRRVEVAS